MMSKLQGMKAFDMLLGTLLIVGGLNWGLVGLFQFNLVDTIFGQGTLYSRLIYILVGAAAVYDIFTIKAIWHRWGINFKEHKAAAE